MRQETLRIKNIEMSYFSFGQGARPMVILPGLDTRSVMLSAPAVESAYKMFSKDYTVYVFDRRANMPDSYTIRNMARDTAICMRELELFDADIFGASQGGMIAQYIAIDYPEMVHAMVLGSTLCRTNPTAESVIYGWIDLALRKNRRGLSEDFIDKLYSRPFAEKYGSALIALNDQVSDRDLHRFIISAKAIFSFDCSYELSKVQCPALVIGVEGDKVVGDKGSYDLARALSSELYMYGREYAHCVFDEAPDYKDRIKAFFEKNAF